MFCKDMFQESADVALARVHKTKLEVLHVHKEHVEVGRRLYAQQLRCQISVLLYFLKEKNPKPITHFIFQQPDSQAGVYAAPRRMCRKHMLPVT